MFRFSRIEVINIETIKLIKGTDLTQSNADLIEATDDDNILVIDGNSNAGESVTSTGEGWFQEVDQTIAAETYHVYSIGSSSLMVDVDIVQYIT